MRKMDFPEAIAKALIKGASKSKPLPTGFGYVFIPNEELTRNVRLVAILTSAMLTESGIGAKDCKDLLLRMGYSIFRFPDLCAAEEFKSILKKVSVGMEGKTVFLEVSKRITWDVIGLDDCLLSQVIDANKTPQSVAKPPPADPSRRVANPSRRVTQPGDVKIQQKPAASTLNKDAAEFKMPSNPAPSIFRNEATEFTPGQYAHNVKPVVSSNRWLEHNPLLFARPEAQQSPTEARKWKEKASASWRPSLLQSARLHSPCSAEESPLFWF